MEQEFNEFRIPKHSLETRNYQYVAKSVLCLLALIKAWLFTYWAGHIVLKLSGEAHTASNAAVVDFGPQFRCTLQNAIGDIFTM